MENIVRIATATAFALIANGATAQTYPGKPLRLIVPFAAGGPVDTVARLIGPKLAESWGQQVVIDNRAGANGIVGSELAAKAAPDGYTLLLVSAGFAVNVGLYPKLPYDSMRDFAPLTLVSSGPAIVVAHPALPVRSIRELIALARSRPGQINYASSGSGAPSHLSVELFKSMARIDLTHIPYKSMAPAITDLIAGQVQLGFPTILAALPQVKAGRLRALAVTGARRSAAAPDIPTVAESGVAGYEAANWFGLMLPAHTPPAVIAKLNGEVARILALPDVRERLSSQGMEAVSNTPDEFAAYLKSEIVKWAAVAKASGARPD